LTELAPDACVVCGLPRPAEPPAENTWVYLAGSVPTGALACSSSCAAEAVMRQVMTGRCDQQRGVLCSS
jgi:hypothetical protein